MTIAFGDVSAIFLATEPTISAFFMSRSSRLMPGLRARPAVMTTISESRVFS